MTTGHSPARWGPVVPWLDRSESNRFLLTPAKGSRGRVLCSGPQGRHSEASTLRLRGSLGLSAGHSFIHSLTCSVVHLLCARCRARAGVSGVTGDSPSCGDLQRGVRGRQWARSASGDSAARRRQVAGGAWRAGLRALACSPGCPPCGPRWPRSVSESRGPPSCRGGVNG